MDELYLKFKKVSKSKTIIIDLRERMELSRDKKSKKQFKIKTLKKELHLRADTEEDRDKWVESILRINQGFFKS